MTPGKVKEHFGQQMGSLLSPEYWCNSQFVAKFMVQIWVAINLAQEYNINGQFLWPVYLPKVWLCHIISAQLHVIEAQERHEKSPEKRTICDWLWQFVISTLSSWNRNGKKIRETVAYVLDIYFLLYMKNMSDDIIKERFKRKNYKWKKMKDTYYGDQDGYILGGSPPLIKTCIN